MNHRKQADYSLSYDRLGNTRRNHWATTWTSGSTRWAKRITNRQERAAGKIKCTLGYEDRLDELDQEYEDSLDWHDDEEMELPDWWYSPFNDPIDIDDEPFERDTNVDQFDDDYFYDPFDY